MLLISFHPAWVTEDQTSPAPPWNRGRLGVIEGSTAGDRFGYRFGPKTGQIGLSRGRRSSNAPRHLSPYDNRPRRGYRRGLCGWRARRDSNPQPEVTDQNKRAMAFRSLKSQASAGRGSHGRKHGQGFGQGYGPESWFSNSWRALGMETRREVDDVRDR